MRKRILTLLLTMSLAACVVPVGGASSTPSATLPVASPTAPETATATATSTPEATAIPQDEIEQNAAYNCPFCIGQE